MGKPDPSLTPEKQLLSLIEEGGQAKKDQPQEKGKPKTEAAKKGFSPELFRGQVAFAKEALALFLKRQRETFSLKKANRTLRIIGGAITFILVVMLVYDIQVAFRGNSNLLQVEQRERAELQLTPLQSPSPELFKDSDEQNIFLPYDKRMGEKKLATVDGISPELLEITKNLKLTGISINDDESERTYCMIEDLTKNITNVLKTGDSIAGLTVDQITPEGIWLSRKDEKVELK